MNPGNQNYQWLMDNGSPAIRIRTWKELMGNNPTPEMVDDLLDFPMTQQWMERLQPNPNFFAIHGSKPECLENVGGKLRELGFHVNMSPAWANRLDIFTDHLKNIGRDKAIGIFGPYNIYATLSTIGCHHPIVLDMAVDHLTQVGDFCLGMDFDIFVDPNTYGGMYSQYAGRTLINIEYNNRLPTIWDIYMLAYMPLTHRREEIEKAENAIINYILTDNYQNFPQGYGIMYDPPTKHYYAHGWNIGLPGWFNLDEVKEKTPVNFLQRIELMSNFKDAQNRKWFQNSVHFLESFQTSNGTSRFPSTFLKEGNGGYYVFGNYLRLEDNRRRKIALELDSTFRMELIRKHVSKA